MKLPAAAGGIAVVVSCATAPPNPEPSLPSPALPPPTIAPVGDAAVDVTPTAPATAQPTARIERLAAPRDDRARLEILFPIVEQRILIPKAPGYVVRTKIEGWPRSAEGRGVLIALDDHRPRRVLDPAELRLGGLVDEGRELAPGPHWLALVAVEANHAVVRGSGGSRAPFAAVRFWIGDRDPKRPPGPGAILVSPAGTYNGPSPEVVVDFLALPERLGPRGATVRVTGAGVTLEQHSSVWQPLFLRDLPSGDFRVEIELDGVRTERVVTVNRDLK